MSKVCQINYAPVTTRMFAHLAQLMLREDLCLGPPRFNVNTGEITQKQGMCPHTGGATNTFKHLGKDVWHCSYDDGEDNATLAGSEIEKWFSGGY